MVAPTWKQIHFMIKKILYRQGISCRIVYFVIRQVRVFCVWGRCKKGVGQLGRNRNGGRAVSTEHEGCWPLWLTESIRMEKIESGQIAPRVVPGCFPLRRIHRQPSIPLPATTLSLYPPSHPLLHSING